MTKRISKSTTRGAGSVADVSVKVDATLKRKYDALVAELRSAKKSGASSFDALWEAAGAILEHDPPLYVVAGYKDAGEFFREELDETRRNAFRYVRVAKFASPREEERYGTTKLDAALSFIEAKLGSPLVHPPLPIAFDRLRVPVKNADGKRTLALDDARVEDIVAATRALSKRPVKPTTSVERAMKERLAKTGPLASVGVRVRDGLVDFTHVPAAALGAFVQALKGLEWESAGESRTTLSTAKPRRKKRRSAHA